MMLVPSPMSLSNSSVSFSELELQLLSMLVSASFSELSTASQNYEIIDEDFIAFSWKRIWGKVAIIKKLSVTPISVVQIKRLLILK